MSTFNRKHIEYVQQKTENRLIPTSENKKHWVPTTEKENRLSTLYLQQKADWVLSTENIMSTFNRKHIEYLQQKTENILSTVPSTEK